MHQIRSFQYSTTRLFSLNRALAALVVVLGLAAFSLPVQAQSGDESDSGAGTDSRSFSVYVEYGLGVSVPPNQSLKGADGSGAGLSGRTELHPGYTVGGAVGVKLMEHFRTELRVDYRASEVNRLAVQGEPNKSKGDLRLLSAMINGFFDYDLHEFHNLDVGVVPFIGAGVGWGRIELQGDNTPGALQTNISDTDSVFVWNVMVGASMPISDVTEVTLGYRYVATEDVRLMGRVNGTPGLPRHLDYEYDAHEAVFGLRFNF